MKSIQLLQTRPSNINKHTHSEQTNGRTVNTYKGKHDKWLKSSISGTFTPGTTKINSQTADMRLVNKVTTHLCWSLCRAAVVNARDLEIIKRAWGPNSTCCSSIHGRHFFFFRRRRTTLAPLSRDWGIFKTYICAQTICYWQQNMP